MISSILLENLENLELAPLTRTILPITELIVVRNFQVHDFPHQSPPAYQTHEKSWRDKKNIAESGADECRLMKQTNRVSWMRERELKRQRGEKAEGRTTQRDGEKAGERLHYDIEQIVLILLPLSPSSISGPIPQPDTFLS